MASSVKLGGQDSNGVDELLQLNERRMSFQPSCVCACVCVCGLSVNLFLKEGTSTSDLGLTALYQQN